MLKTLSAIAVAATIAAVITLPPASPVQAQSAEPAVKTALSETGCERAWPYPRCSAEGRLPAQNIRMVTADRLPDLRSIREASAR
jgi:hypothetical protein